MQRRAAPGQICAHTTYIVEITFFIGLPCECPRHSPILRLDGNLHEKVITSLAQWGLHLLAPALSYHQWPLLSLVGLDTMSAHVCREPCLPGLATGLTPAEYMRNVFRDMHHDSPQFVTSATSHRRLPQQSIRFSPYGCTGRNSTRTSTWPGPGVGTSISCTCKQRYDGLQCTAARAALHANDVTSEEHHTCSSGCSYIIAPECFGSPPCDSFRGSAP